jgi:carboxymethylenebutenolidase
MQETRLNVPTKVGTSDTFICHPERGGPYPGVIFYMDAPGIREELYDMARRIATVGYYVMLPNLYYRHGHGTTCGPDCTTEGHPEFKQMVDLMMSVTNAMIAEDTASFIAHLDKQPQVKKGPLGAVGYCMSGPFAVTAGASHPERFGAVASFHGVPMVTDQPDSPHLTSGKMKAEAYFGFGEVDPLTPKKDVDAFKAAVEKTSLRHELEVYPGASHGFVFPDRAAYHKEHAERHWERLFALFRRTVG